MPSVTFVLGEVLVRPSVAVPAVFEKVQVMLSPFAGVTLNDWPAPEGNTVAEAPFVFEHEIELKYWPITDGPEAFASVSVYVVPAARVLSPEVALTPAPTVVPEPTVTAPFLIETMNWSSAFARDTTVLFKVRCGFAVLVSVHVMLSAAPGVIEKDVPEPDGRTVADPPRLFEHEMVLR